VTPRIAAARFVARMVWRETRGAVRHFAYSLACIAIGVAALVAVQSFADSLARTIARSAKALLGGDVEIRSAQPLPADAEAVIAHLQTPAMAMTRVRELVAMAQIPRIGRAQIVELKAVETGYPLYGLLATDPALPLTSLVGHGRALAHPSLLTRLGLAVGDRLRIGELECAISGVITDEPDRVASIFSLGPRVLISADDLDRTGLVRPGSRVRYRTLVKLGAGADAEAFRDELARALPETAQRIVAYTQAQPGLRRFWAQLTMYLGLAGLAVLMVGGIGVAVSVSAFVHGKRSTIAVLKCLGVSRREVFAIYLGQTAFLGLGGSAVGAVLGSALQPVLSPLLARLLPFPVPLAPSPRAVLSGLAMGVGVTLLFSWWPLSGIRWLPPALILRSQVEPVSPRGRPWPAALVIVGGLSALTLWQAGSWTIGGLFIGGVALAFALLTLCARLIVAVSRRARRGSLAWRQGVGNLHRPGSQATTVVIALGLSVMLIVAVTLLERVLRQELTDKSAGVAPAFFFIDIQPDQAEPFSRLVTTLTGRAPDLTPVVRARLVAVNGAPIAKSARAGREDNWYLTREYALTWAAEPPHHNTIVAGRWWTGADAARGPLISVEEEVAQLLHAGLGATLTFDIQGVEVTAEVANLRHVDWNSFNSNFFVIFSPGPLDSAPTTSIATAWVTPDGETRVQSAVVAAFPNVTAIPVREVIERVSSTLDQIALAMRLVAALAVLTGLVVTAGALAITRHQRLYQSVILKTLGATRGVVGRIFAVEYALLGAGAGVGGTALATVLAWVVLRFAFDVAWSWSPGTILGGILAAVVLAVAVGALGTYRLLGAKPLRVLRSE